MSLVINTNTIANTVRNTLTTNQSNLQKSLARLSSGSKIVDPTDDAGGLAVATKLAATLNRNARTQQNVQNTISFLQVQDGALAQATSILDRMSELKVMSLDPTKNSDDIANYDAEFTQLQAQLTSIKAESFNGIDLFNANSNLTVYTTEEGDAAGEPSISATRTGLFQSLGNVAYGGTTGDYSVTEYNVSADYDSTSGGASAEADGATFIKSTNADGTIRLGLVAADITGNGTSTFQDHVDSGDVIEISNVDSIYDYETNTVKSRLFTATGTLETEHAQGQIVFDDASNSFYLAVGQALDYTDSTQGAGAGNTIQQNPGEFIKLEKYPMYTDFDQYSASTSYETGDLVAFEKADGTKSAYVAIANVAAGTGGSPENNAAGFLELSQVATQGGDLMTTSNTLSNYTVGDFTTFIQNAATARAQNGAESARLNSALEMLKSNQGNLDAARSRLADVDVALESTNLAKQNILVQSAAAMLSQANASQNVALQLLG